MAITLQPPPLKDAVIESAKAPFITKTWATFFRVLADRLQSSAQTQIAIALSAQSASIALTSLVASASGLYRVSYRFRVTSAAAVSSSLQVTITTTSGGVTCTQSSAAYTGNVTNAPQSGSFIVKADPLTPISYNTTYASNPGATMVYELNLVVEAL